MQKTIVYILIMLYGATSSLHSAFLCRPRKTVAQIQQEKTSMMWEAIYKDDLAKFQKQFQQEPHPSLQPQKELSPFLCSCLSQNKIIAAWLLEHAHSFQITQEDLNKALLMSASDTFAQKLLTHGAHIDTQNEDGYTPLTIAVLSRKAYMVDFFLKREADESIKSNEGLTARQFLNHMYATIEDFPHEVWHVFEEHSKTRKIAKSEAEKISANKDKKKN